MKAFGAGTLTQAENGTNTKFAWEVSYRLDNQVVTFFNAFFPSGSDAHLLGRVDIRPANEVSNAAKLPVIHGAIMFSFGESGMSFRDLRNKLGAARLDKGTAEYQYQKYTDMGRDSQGMALVKELSVWLRIKIKGDHVECLTLSHVTVEFAETL